MKTLHFWQLIIRRCLLFWLCAYSVCFGVSYAGQHANQELAFYQLADDYFDRYYFPTYPSTATQLGVHRYDDKLEQFSKSALDVSIATLKQYEKHFGDINVTSFSQRAQQDRVLLLNQIKSQLLDLQAIRYWQINPDMYSSAAANSAFVIISRQYAPINQRLQSLIAREKAIPDLFIAAKDNLHNPPSIFTEIALEQLLAIILFFQRDVPDAFKHADPKLIQEFVVTNQRVVNALQAYQEWLKTVVLPASHGNYRLGKSLYVKKLQYDEMVEQPLPALLAINAANMRENQNSFKRIAKELEPGKSPQAMLAAINAHYPQPEHLLSEFRATFAHLIKFIKVKKIITIPSDVQPMMEETPAFLRSITFASMDTPGPFEKTAKEAFFNVTLPEPSWSKERITQFMGQFSYPSISSISIHEAYPGHYVQFLWMHDVSGRVRKIIGSRTNAEGWAHYAEQMMLDEGYGDYVDPTDPRQAKMLRLGQLLNALLRNARFTVGIEMHAGRMTFNQAVDYFVKEGYQPKAVGVVEAKRATLDPTYLYYTLGKLQILKLRADLMKKQGKSFQLQRFHDDFMRQGYPPIKIVRETLLGDNSPTL